MDKGNKIGRLNYVHLNEATTTFEYDNRGKNHVDYKPLQETTILLDPEPKGGLTHPRALLFLALWYIFSGCTLFLNKYILSYMSGDPTILGEL